MSFAKSPAGQHHRSGDFANPLWGLLDITPQGRGIFFRKSFMSNAGNAVDRRYAPRRCD